MKAQSHSENLAENNLREIELHSGFPFLTRLPRSETGGRGGIGEEVYSYSQPSRTPCRKSRKKEMVQYGTTGKYITQTSIRFSYENVPQVIASDEFFVKNKFNGFKSEVCKTLAMVRRRCGQSMI